MSKRIFELALEDVLNMNADTVIPISGSLSFAVIFVLILYYLFY